MDYSSSRALQIFLSYLISKGKINEDMYYYLFGDNIISKKEQLIMLHSHYRNFYGMLSMLTLYDDIIIYPTRNIEPIDESLLDELGIHYFSDKKKLWSGEMTKKVNPVDAKNIEDIIRIHKREILGDFRQEKCYSEYWINYKFDLSDSFEYYFERKYHLDMIKNVKLEDRLSSLINQNIWGRTPQNILKTGEYDFMDYLDATIKSLSCSIQNRYGTFSSKLFSSNNWRTVMPEDLEKLDTVVLAADLSGGIGVIPYPETIEEVIAWRKYAEMKAFRAVFSDWIYSMRSGDISLSCKIKLDIERANKQLLKLEGYDKLNRNVMIALINIGLSKIPAIDILKTATDFVTPYIIDYQNTKNSWVNLPAFNSKTTLYRNLKHRKNE